MHRPSGDRGEVDWLYVFLIVCVICFTASRIVSKLT